MREVFHTVRLNVSDIPGLIQEKVFNFFVLLPLVFLLVLLGRQFFKVDSLKLLTAEITEPEHHHAL